MNKKVEQLQPKCGLCGKSRKLKKTECCDQWICDDEDKYVMFTYARNSCSRNHRRYTLCGAHYAEDHKGKWQDCKTCREDFEPEMVVYFGTNQYNFETLPNPPEYEPTHCSNCSAIIKLGTDGYTISKGQCWCVKCKPMPF